jgi:polyisoprenoid-binding protein YceI
MRVLLCFIVCTAGAFGQTERVQLDPGATHIGFTLGDVLHTVHGTFKLKSSDLWFDTSTGKAGGRIVVDARSGDSGSGARDSRMNKNVLESEKYPEIVFAPDRVEGPVNLAGDSTVKLHGQFAIHGATHDVLMSATTHIDPGNKLTATIHFAVPYVAWGMKNPSTFLLKVSETVEIEIQTAGEIRAPGP